MIFFVDFDGTICPRSGEPKAECLNYLKELKRRNHTIVIYSCRSNPNAVSDFGRATHDMKNFLNHFRVPYDSIEYGKPFFNYIIDDRAIGVPVDSNDDVDWAKLTKITEERNLW